MATSVSGGTPPAGQNHLHRAIGLRALTLISLGSIIGSGWLLGALTAATAAGAASLVSWIMAGGVLALLALVHAELGSTYPVSGGTARFPYMIFGAIGGLTGGWMAWVQAVTIAPIEVEATIGYLNSQYPSLDMVKANGTLDGKGIALGAGFMVVFTVINIMGVRWLAESNSIATYWKILIPTLTIFALLFTTFHTSNFSAGGGFVPYGFHGIFAALPLGIVFALEGFEQAIQVGGEAENPQRNIPRAVIGSMLIGTAIYLLLEVAFVGALDPANLAGGWADPIKGVGAFGPYATLASNAGLGWLSTLLIIDAVVSPAGTGLIYLGTSSRLAYGLGRNGYFPKAISQVNRRGVPLVSIIICFVIGMLTFLPFPSWAGLVGLVTSATVLMYAMAPLSLAGLRRTDPDRPRLYRLPFAGVLCPLAFILANCIVYFAGWSNVFWLYMFVVLGFGVFGIYQMSIPGHRRTIIEWRSAYWVIPWLLGLGIISWQGQYTSSTTTVFDLTLNPTLRIGQWWDLGLIAIFSLAIYYWAVYSGLSREKVQEAVETVEAEASVELATPLT
ncbi:MAG TPA: APC family permease [Streptosporangiaceae bacterium]|nr:APC family permease [Streptosporangiaceae bacterium]